MIGDVGEPLRDAAEKKNAIPGGKRQRQITKDVASDLREQLERRRASGIGPGTRTDFGGCISGRMISECCVEVRQAPAGQYVFNSLKGGPQSRLMLLRKRQRHMSGFTGRR